MKRAKRDRPARTNSSQPLMDWKTHFDRLSRAPSFGGEGEGASFGSSGVGAGTRSAAWQVQEKLNALGARPPLQVDGIWGAASQAALKAYQAAHHLTVDGRIGAQVLKAMGLHVVLPTVQGPAIPGLKQAVVNAFPSFSAAFEGGGLPFMYPDIKGLVTTGTGNLIDPGAAAGPGAAAAPEPYNSSLAQKLPWKHAGSGAPATPAEIDAAFRAVKAAWPAIGGPHGAASTTAAGLNDLRMGKVDLDALMFGKLKNNHQALAALYPDYPGWPADAQMAMHSLAWAWGPGFASVWNKIVQGAGDAFKAAVAAKDFKKAAAIMKGASAHEEQVNPGLVGRNDANVQLFANAEAVAKNGGKGATTLFYPNAAAGFVTVGLALWLAGAAAALGYMAMKGRL